MSEKPFALLVGDALLDRWIDGEMTRISPEAPAPILLQKSVAVSPGGAGNVAVNIRSLGGHVFFATATNCRSEAALSLKHQFETIHGIATCWCHADRLYTPTKTRLTVEGQQILRLDDEQSSVNEVGHTEALMRGIQSMISPGSATRLLVVSDYAKGVLVPTVAQYLLDASRALSLPLFVDAKPSQVRQWAGATLLKINAKEAQQVAMEDGCLHPGLAVADSAPEIAAAHIRDRYHFANVVVTCGAAGAVCVDAAGVRCVPTVPQRIYDVMGAGDVFLAAMAVGYLDGATFDESVSRANVAAGLAVQRHGPTAITRDEWEDGVLAQRGWAGKIMGLEAAVAFAKRKRDTGKSIVLANGCFDALHVGHIQTLAFARQQGDVLIVACNDDASIHAIKGEGRPLIPEQFRTAQLAMLSVADCVVRFDGDVEQLVRKLQPNILVKGAQYREARVPGADYIASRGGRVAFAPMIPEISTTKLNTPSGRPC